MSPKNRIMNNNYHTHMYLCRHAIGDVQDYVEEAIRLGFKTLGMSDHAPFKELKDRSVRMVPSDFPLYLQKCLDAREKYKNQIQLHIGLEIEYFEDHDEIYKDWLTKVDYLVLGQHYISDPNGRNNLRSSYDLAKKNLTKYVDMVIEAMKTKYFLFLAHPDLMLYSVSKFDSFIEEESRRLIQAAVDTNTPLEINANGIRRGTYMMHEGQRYIYPRLEFWKLVKEMGGKVIISSDAHRPENLYDDVVEEAYKFASQIGIEVEEELMI